MSKIELKLADGERLAAWLIQCLAPYCERIQVAGSIRRRRPSVGDIELVAIPQTVQRRVDLLHTEARNHCIERVDELIEDGYIERIKGGEKWQRLRLTRPAPVQVDLFFADQREFPVLLAIRTGPARFSKRLVTQMGPSGFGLLPRGWRIKNGWRVYDEQGRERRFASEREFLTACACAWLEPEERR